MVHDPKVIIAEEDAVAEVIVVIAEVRVDIVAVVGDTVVTAAEGKEAIVGVAEVGEVAVAVVMLHHSQLPDHRYGTSTSMHWARITFRGDARRLRSHRDHITKRWNLPRGLCSIARIANGT